MARAAYPSLEMNDAGEDPNQFNFFWPEVLEQKPHFNLSQFLNDSPMPEMFPLAQQPPPGTTLLTDFSSSNCYHQPSGLLFNRSSSYGPGSVIDEDSSSPSAGSLSEICPPAPPSSSSGSDFPSLVSIPEPQKSSRSSKAAKRDVISDQRKVVVFATGEMASFPALPEDFNQYAPGGELHRCGERMTTSTPDFSGKLDWWGVGEDAYNALPLRQKKQLRNKVGARRFRERRKNYISTLEDHLAERDRIISEYRFQLLRSQATLDQIRGAPSSSSPNSSTTKTTKKRKTTA